MIVALFHYHRSWAYFAFIAVISTRITIGFNMFDAMKPSKFHSSLCTRIQHTVDSITNRKYATVLRSEVSSSMGSDALFRPDDEDSPEFKEYLRNLQKMMANRAKTGFSSPSSQSADAYLAKLQRLKLEKLARFKAGLPDIQLDTSYKPEDYISAKYQASEVAIMSGGTAKVRPLSTEEIGLQRMAEEKAQQLKKELEALKSSPLVSSPGAAVAAVFAKSRSAAMAGLTSESSSSQTMAGLTSESSSSQTMAGLTSESSSSQTMAGLTSESSSSQSSRVQHVDAIDSSASLRKQISAPSSSELDMTVKQEAIPRKPKSTLAVPVASTGETQKEELKRADVKMIRKLDKDELEIAGKALQLSVMHRGGGPFGAGRLVANEAHQLSAALHAAYDLLKRDAGSAVAVQTELPVSKSLEEVVELPILKGVAVKSDAIPQKVNDRVPPVVQVEHSQTASSTKTSAARPQQVRPAAIIPSPDHSEQSSVESKPIALGLDSFLQNPRSMDLNELNALRDGLIQCLSMVQSAVISHGTSPNPADPNRQLTPSKPPIAETSRMVDKYYAADGSMAASVSAPVPVERDLKLALGLLLKHRGGPGFGHGRLQGPELDLLESKLRLAADLLSTE